MEELLAHIKGWKENGNAKGKESNEKGWNDLLEEMFSRVKDLRDDVKTSDQRAGKEARKKNKKNEKKLLDLEGGKRLKTKKERLWHNC